MSDAARLTFSGSRVEALLGQIADDFTERLRRGERPQIEEYLATHPELSGVLRQILPVLLVTHDSLAGLPGGATALEPSLAETRRLGDFRIIREIARGGMGIVYEAEQVSLARRVALKVLPFAGALDPRALTRFHTEAQSAAQLHHTNIVPVYAVGCDQGVHYYAMQYIEGCALSEAIRRLRAQQTGRLPAPSRLMDHPPGDFPVPDSSPREERGAADSGTRSLAMISTQHASDRGEFFRVVARLGIQAAEGLEYAHQRGVIHRDIKPANLLLDELENLWITDFGLARMGQERQLTLTGDLVGTLPYLSPESIAGGENRGLVDHRTDIYSLGVTLYELLTLEPAFSVENRAEIVRKIASVDPRALRDLDRSIPVELETIVLKAMEKAPEDRYATAHDLADDLRRFLAHRPIAAQRPTAWNRLRKWSRRHRRTLVAAALVLLVMLSGAAIAHWRIDAERSATEIQKQAANLNLRIAREQEVIADQQKQLATERQQLADERGTLIEREKYCQDMRVAWDHLVHGKGFSARPRLDEYRDDPEASSTFAWRYLNRLCSQSEEGYSLFGSQVYWVEFSPDDRQIVVGLQSGIAIVKDLVTGLELFRLTGHTDCVNAARYTPDGRQLWTASCDGTIRSWDAADGRQLEVFASRGARVETLALSPDGRLLAAGEQRDGSQLLVWDIEQRQLLFEQVVCGGDRIDALAFSADGALLAVAASDAAKVFDVRSNFSKVVSDRRGAESVSTVAFLPDDNVAIWGKTLSDVGQWFEFSDLDGADPDAYFSLRNSASALAVTPNGQRVIVGSGNGTIDVFDREHGRLQEIAQHYGARVSCLAVSHDGERVAAGAFDETVYLYRLGDVQESQRTVHPAGAGRVCFAAGGRYLIAQGAGFHIRGFDTRDWSQRFEFKSPCDLIVSSDTDCPRFATLDGSDWCVRHFDAATGVFVEGSERQFPVDTQQSEYAGQSACDGQRLFVTSSGREGHGPYTIEEWDTRRNDARVVARPRGYVEGLALHGQFLAYGVRDGLLSVIDLATGEERWSVDHLAVICAVRISPDGKFVAAACHDRRIHVFELATGALQIVLEGHEPRPTCMAFTPDSRELISGGASGTLRIWDLCSQYPLMTLNAGPFLVASIAVSPDGRMLATASRGHNGAGSVQVWSARDRAGEPGQ